MNNKIKTYLLVIFSILSLILCVYPTFADKAAQPDEMSEPVKNTAATAAKPALTTTETPDKAPAKEDGKPEEVAIPSGDPANESIESPVKKADSIKSEAGVNYTVKKGDTLWNLSKRFNNSAWRWPGVWSDNKQLKNPHLIYPGQKIKLFYRSDMDHLRRLAPVKVNTMENKKTAGSVAPVKISDTTDSSSESSASINLPYYHYSKIGGIGFMTDKPSEAHGCVFKVKGLDRIMIGTGNEVFIQELNKKSLIPGAKYFTYKILDPSFIKKRTTSESKLFQRSKTVKTKVGYQHYITGVVQITSKKSGYAVGTVIQSYRDISIKDFLIPYTNRSPDITLSASKEGLDGYIITSEEGEGQFGDDKVAFVDKGSDDGVKPGQMYNIFYPEEKDSSELFGGKKLFIPVDFASFIVLLTTPHTSTVLITSANQGVSAGDGWHYPQK